MRRLFALGFLATLAMALYALACDDGTHVFVGSQFEEGRGCLDAPASVDAVEGKPPGTCAPQCLTQARYDGGRAVYVATMCAPYPYGVDAAGTDPACPAALAALSRGDGCFDDGGLSHPASPADAGTD